MDNGFICICCRRRFRWEDAVIAEHYLGICMECNERIEYVKAGSVLPGGGALDSLFAAARYEGIIKSAIGRYKFASQPRYAKMFAMMLYNQLKGWHLEREFDFITAIPLSRKRLYERGYCQTELIAKPLAERLGIPYVGNCVYKKRHNQKQSRLNIKALRFENVQDTYLADSLKVKGKSILLLDDIYTSGATMKACAEELKNRGAESVVGVSLAVVLRDV